MAEYLIQDTSLDAIADAINAKTGGSAAMTPAEMVTAIGSISGGGGGLQSATGTATLATGGKLTIPHNLDSTNVVCLVCPTGTISATYGYQYMTLVAANFAEEFATELADVKYDFTRYNSNFTDVYERTGPYPIGASLKSPWSTNGAAQWDGTSWSTDPAYISPSGKVSFLQNSVTLDGVASGTYKWKVIKL